MLFFFAYIHDRINHLSDGRIQFDICYKLRGLFKYERNSLHNVRHIFAKTK